MVKYITKVKLVEGVGKEFERRLNDEIEKLESDEHNNIEDIKFSVCDQQGLLNLAYYAIIIYQVRVGEYVPWGTGDPKLRGEKVKDDRRSKT